VSSDTGRYASQWINTGGATESAGLGDMNKTGAEYLATLPPDVQGTVKAMVEGRLAPPSSFGSLLHESFTQHQERTRALEKPVVSHFWRATRLALSPKNASAESPAQ